MNEAQVCKGELGVTAPHVNVYQRATPPLYFDALMVISSALD
jgi:hypothetical protein